MSDEGALQVGAHRHSTWSLCAASAVVGIAAGGFLVLILGRLHLLPPFLPYVLSSGRYVAAYEVPVALLGALGIWSFTPLRGRWSGLLGVGSALLAMLFGDTLRVMSETSLYDWEETPRALLRLLRWGGWAKLLRYAFGMYVAWYICSSGRARAPEPGEERGGNKP